MQIQQANFGFDNKSFDIEKSIQKQPVSATDDYNQLKSITQKNYEEVTRLTREQYEKQLENLSLIKEQRANLITEMY